MDSAFQGTDRNRRLVMQRHFRRQQKLACRDLIVSAGFSLFTMALATGLGPATFESAIFFVGGSCVAYSIAIHRVTQVCLWTIELVPQVLFDETKSAAA